MLRVDGEGRISSLETSPALTLQRDSWNVQLADKTMVLHACTNCYHDIHKVTNTYRCGGRGWGLSSLFFVLGKGSAMPDCYQLTIANRCAVS